MKIRRITYYAGIKDKDFVKALSLLCYLKNKFQSSVVSDYTLDKIHKITGLHSNTCKERIKVLMRLGFVEAFTTKGGRVMLKLNSIASKHNNRNIDLNCVVFDSVKSVEKSLYAIYIGEIQKHKEYVRQTVYEAHNSYDLNKLKEAKKRSRSYGDKFVDNGLSYNGIAKRLKVSLQKAFRIVSFAVEFNFLVKIKRQYQLFCRDARNRFEFCKNDVMKFMFCTKNNLYLILANQYQLGGRLNQLGN